jgi:hypothetical protein
MSLFGKSAMFVLKGLIGYTIGFAPLFAVLALAFKIPLRQLLVPYILLMLPFIVFLAIRLAPDKYAPSLPARLSLATAVSFLLCLPIFTYYGVKLGVFRRDFAIGFFWIGLLGVGAISVTVFYLMQRRRAD